MISSRGFLPVGLRDRERIGGLAEQRGGASLENGATTFFDHEV